MSRHVLVFLVLGFFIPLARSECVLNVTETIDGGGFDDLIRCLPAAFGMKLTSGTSLEGVLIPTAPENSLGCDPIDRNDDDMSWLSLVQRGNCTFVEKATNVQTADAKAMIVVSDDDSISTMSSDEDDLDKISILSVMISKTDGEKIEGSAVRVAIQDYQRPSFDISVLVLALSASILVVAGAFWSAVDERRKYYSPPGGDGGPRAGSGMEVAVINQTMACGFIVVASAALLLLFFFISSLIWLIIVIFCIGGTTGLVSLLSPAIKYVFPTLKRPRYQYMIPYVGETIGVVDLLLLPICISFAVWWVLVRHEYYGWVLQNILCIGLIMMFQKTIRIPNLKIASILLCTMFIYDIFWVFISPVIFEKSVMIEVATGGGTGETVPLLIVFPRTKDALSHYGSSFSMLGLGDIALPGLFISFLLRFDYEMGYKTWKRGYFLIGVIGYVVGLLITDIVLVTTRMGQPALLYLVPLTLVPVSYIAYRRGELSMLWRGLHSTDYANVNEDPEMDQTVDDAENSPDSRAKHAPTHRSPAVNDNSDSTRNVADV